MDTLEIQRAVSKDGSRKYSFEVESGRRMESAFFTVPGRERPHIACVSTQLGCAVACPFCAAAQAPFFRNLTADEILFQVDAVLEDHSAALDEILAEGFEVSFMGAGEPLANLTNLLETIRRIHLRYPQITRVSVSTAGPARRIEALTAAMPTVPPVHLQISLHATTDETRRRLVPNAPDSIKNLLDAGRRFHEKTADQVFLNYVLLKGINDSDADARWLAHLDRQAFYVKIAALNDIAGMPPGMVGASLDDIFTFSRQLDSYRLPHKIFVGDGLDVGASCGQLAAVPREVRAPASTSAVIAKGASLA